MRDNAPVLAAHTLLLRAGAVLLIRRHKTGLDDGKYGLVGGRVEDGESIAQTAVRECGEEVGVEIDPADLEIIGVAHFVRSAAGRGVDFFLRGTRWTGDPYPRSECDEVRWYPLDALPSNTIPFARRAIEHHLVAGEWFDEVDF